ncbi:mercuric reductase [Terriglobus aquaticus]|uniref:Mercuric reductase n=1 Tax=Terriglobus aquaticus TaxID=940139 RepID=A0ABW9KPP3_9BACT|nr:mercuric reductase [Terriglobus aquaticus]
MADEQFDAVVIGTGQSGNPLARAMASHGWRVAAVERRYVGGTCVNDGCSPSKTIDASAKVAYLARRGADFGVKTGPISVDMHKVWERKQKVVLGSRDGNATSLAKVSTLLMGEASFAQDQPGNGQFALDVTMNEGGGTRRLVTPRVFLNTGERPHPPKLEGLDSVQYLDSTSIMELQEVPEHLVILGAGYIALEFAQMFVRFGAKVTVLERGEKIAQHEDDDVAACLRGILEADGIRILTCASVDRVTGGPGAITLTVTTDDGEQDVTGSHLLVATGRTPNVEALHLERVGVHQGDKSGHIQVNERLETNVPGIWAMGDVKGGPAFTHISYDDFRVIRTNVLEGGDASIAGRMTNYTMFTDPELGRIGLSEKDAAEQGRKVRVASIPATKIARLDEMDQSSGLLKAIVDAESGKILGGVALVESGGEMAAQLQLAIMGDLPYTALRDAVFAHPTRAEAWNNLFTSFQDGQP